MHARLLFGRHVCGRAHHHSGLRQRRQFGKPAAGGNFLGKVASILMGLACLTLVKQAARKAHAPRGKVLTLAAARAVSAPAEGLDIISS